MNVKDVVDYLTKFGFNKIKFELQKRRKDGSFVIDNYNLLTDRDEKIFIDYNSTSVLKIYTDRNKINNQLTLLPSDAFIYLKSYTRKYRFSKLFS